MILWWLQGWIAGSPECEEKRQSGSEAGGGWGKEGGGGGSEIVLRDRKSVARGPRSRDGTRETEVGGPRVPSFKSESVRKSQS